MPTAKNYLDILREREPQLWPGVPEASALTEADLLEIEAGLGYRLPEPYREFLTCYKMPRDLTVLVSFCGDSYANSWDSTYSREENGYVPRPESDIGPTAEFEWHNIPGDTGAAFLEALKREQTAEEDCPCFLEAGFIQLGEVFGYLTFLDLVNGGVVTIHEEGVYDMLSEGVQADSREEVRRYMESYRLYICKNFSDFLRLLCTGDYLDENEARFPSPEELEQYYLD